MPNNAPRLNVSRRVFLRSLGIAAGTCATLPLIGPAAAQVHAPALPSATALPQRQQLTIAMLLPQSGMVPLLGPSLLDGLRLAVASSATPIQVLPIAYGSTPREAHQQAEELIAQGQADVIVAAMSRHEAAALAPLLEQHATPLIVSDVGANMLYSKQQHPFIFRSSLNHWRSAWALGQWAAANLGQRALIASSFYDSGYDTIYAFWSGFEQAGGQRPALVVTNRPDRPGVADALAAIQQERPDVVFGAYSGRHALEFTSAYAASNTARSFPLLGSSFLADHTLGFPQAAALGIRSAHSWVSDLPTPTSQTFTSSFHTQFGYRANAFAALGYDTGKLVLAALDQAGDQRGLAFRDALAGAAADGVRGQITFDPVTLDVRSPIYLRQVQPGGAGAAHPAIADLTTLAANPLAIPAGARGGWKNAYLVV